MNDMKQTKGKKQYPDREANSLLLEKHFPGLYPCRRCRRNGTCSWTTMCDDYKSFLHKAWTEILILLKGDTV